eukprot:gene468-biopygen9438
MVTELRIGTQRPAETLGSPRMSRNAPGIPLRLPLERASFPALYAIVTFCPLFTAFAPFAALSMISRVALPIAATAIGGGKAVYNFCAAPRPAAAAAVPIAAGPCNEGCRPPAAQGDRRGAGHPERQHVRGAAALRTQSAAYAGMDQQPSAVPECVAVHRHAFTSPR